MTNKTTMPEPFTFFHGYRTQDLNGNKDDKPPMPYVGLPLFTTYQAEAYAAAKVREALEEAAMILKANAEACHSDTRIMLRANAEAILSLIKRVA